MKSRKQSKRGGRRRGAGRPRRNPPAVLPEGLDWGAVDALAAAGAEPGEILAAFGVERPSPAVTSRLHAACARGGARLKLAIRAAAKARGIDAATTSVNVLGLLARNALGWDRVVPPQGPTVAVAVSLENLTAVLDRLAEQRAEQRTAPPPVQPGISEIPEEKPAAVTVAVVYRDGRAAQVTIEEAARVIGAGQATPAGDWDDTALAAVNELLEATP